MDSVDSKLKALIEDLLPTVDELVALLEYYDNATYRAAVVNLVERLQEAGLAGFDDKGLNFDSERHEEFKSYSSDDVEVPTVCHTHLRGYEFEGEVIRRSVVDVRYPEAPIVEVKTIDAA